MAIKRGSKVVIKDAFCPRTEESGKVWSVRCDPWQLDTKQVVLLVGSHIAWLVECLEEVGDDGKAKND
ncbi:MAG: hypothetical protein RR547_12185 [Raoultibacter sp.]